MQLQQRKQASCFRTWLKIREALKRIRTHVDEAFGQVEVLEELQGKLENLVKRWAGEVGSSGTTRSRTGELGEEVGWEVGLLRGDTFTNWRIW